MADGTVYVSRYNLGRDEMEWVEVKTPPKDELCWSRAQVDQWLDILARGRELVQSMSDEKAKKSNP